MEKRKKIAREKVLQQVSDKELEIDINDIYPSEKGLIHFGFNSSHPKINLTDGQSRLMEWVTARHTNT